MKNLLFSLLTLAAVAGVVAGDGPGTTPKPKTNSPIKQEEYNYITKGYRFQVESGLDPVKEGYRWGSYEERYFADANSLVGTRALIRTKDNSLAGTLLYIFSYTTQKKYYLCIPNTNKYSNEFLTAFGNELNGLKSRDLNAYNAAMAVFIEKAMYFLEIDY